MAIDEKLLKSVIAEVLKEMNTADTSAASAVEGETSEQLRMVFLLIDLRHKPTNNDVQMYRWILSNGFSPVIVATKADKIKRSQLQKQLKLLKDTLKVIEGVPIVPFSAVTKAGRDEIWELIEEYALAEE